MAYDFGDLAEPVQKTKSNYDFGDLADPIQKPHSLIEKVGKYGGAVFEPVAQMATGMIAKPAADIAGLAAIPLHAAGAIQTDPAEVRRKVLEAGTYEPKTTAGKLVSEYNPLALAGKGIGAVAGAAGDVVGGGEAADTLRGAAGNFVREAIPQAVGLAGMKVAPKVGAMAEKSIAGKQSALDVLKSQNLAKDAVIQAGHDAGFTFTPDELRKFGAGNKIGTAAEDIGGLHVYRMKEANALDKLASIKNSKTTEKLTREELTLPNMKPVPKGMTISEKAMEGFRKLHGKVYAAIEKIKDPILYTPEYESAIKNLNSDLAAMKEQYPDLAKADGLATLQNALLSGKPVGAGTEYIGYETEHGMPYDVTTPSSTNAAAAMQLIRNLREKSATVLKKDSSKLEEVELAKLQKKAANAVEELIGQHLKDNGKIGLFNAFQNSRKNIAKSYEIERALKGGTVIDAQRLATSTSDLTGNLKVIKDMALQHPNLMLDPRDISSSGAGHAAGALVGGATIAGGIMYPATAPLAIPAGVAIAARPWVNDLLLSKGYQKKYSVPQEYKASELPSKAAKAIPTVSATVPASSEAERARRKKERSK